MATALALILSAATASAQAASICTVNGIATLCDPQGNPRPGATGDTMLDPALAERRRQAADNYIFRDRNLAAAANFKELGYGSRQEMLADFEARERIVNERQYVLRNFFNNPKMPINNLDFARLGFSSIDELGAWLKDVSEMAFRTNSINPF